MISTTIYNYTELAKGRDRSNSWNSEPIKDLSKSRNSSEGINNATSLKILRKVTADELLLTQKTAFLQKVSPMLKPLSPKTDLDMMEKTANMPTLTLDGREEQPLL